MKQRKFWIVLVLVLVAILCMSSVVACKDNNDNNDGNNNDDTPAVADTRKIYKTYTSSFATNWNVQTYETEEQSSMFSYSSSSFYEFDYKYDDEDKVVDGEFSVVPTMASGYPTDVTSEYVGSEWGIEEGSDSLAWYIPLRKGMKWDNGDPITPDQFVYSMKMQLSPNMLPYRADSYYAGSIVLHNAENYLKQGTYNYTAMISADYGPDEYFDIKDLTESNGVAQYQGKDCVVNVKSGGNWGSAGLEKYYDAYKNKFETAGISDAIKAIIDKADDNGYAKLSKTDVNTMCGAIAVLQGYEDAAAYAEVQGDYAYQEWEEMCYFGYIFGEVSFDNVGLKAVDDGTRYGIIIILDKPIADSESHYHWAYDFGGNWLVKPDVYEACLVKPASGLWTSTYGTSPATSPSYGPYKLTDYQVGKSYTFERNTNWFGYSIPELSEGFYETDAIQCTLIEEWDSAWMAFQKGEISAISIDPKIANEYKTSKRAYFTPSDFVSTMQLQSQVKTEPDDGNAVELLSNNNFRKALSLAIDRDAMAKQTTTSSLAGYGLFNSMHYYDVENGKVYRNTDIAKQVICDTYGVEYGEGEKYATLDEAYAAVTGYDLEQAKALVKQAIEEEIANGTIKATDSLTFTMISSSENEAAKRPMNFLKAAWSELFKGTQFDGKFDIKLDGIHGDNYATDFKSGQGHILMAGWSGAAWDPCFFISAYILDQYRYAYGWNPSDSSITITIPGIGPDGIEGNADDGADFTITASALELCKILNGSSGVGYDWSSGKLDIEKRLIVLGALEKCVLETYYSVPTTYYFSAALRSMQIESFTTSYNTFMGWGGIKYYSYNYNQAEWAAYVASQGGILNYK